MMKTDDAPQGPRPDNAMAVLGAAIENCRRLLPDQGPIDVFIHHNTLHGLQHLPFHEAVQRGAMALGARPYPELEFFQAAFKNDRIRVEDIEAEILHHLG